ncbi:hypothetical protein G6F31_013399 [Rhizopus arrhizus]|nr:hypothetical protein G6F31_013399 [Rhizopus arrhizus]
MPRSPASIIGLADELTEDFRRVRDDFEQLNRDFRERIIDDEGERGDVLSQLFEGVDVIGESDAGRSFQAFWRLLNDAEQSAQLDAALEAVLARGFARRLDRNERNFLRGFTSTMLERGGQVHDVLQNFARSLRGFVQSRGYLEQRRLNQLLKQAQSEALALRDEFPAQRGIGRDLQLTTSRLRSWSQWKLHDPRSAQVDGNVEYNDAAAISLESVGDLVASSEIDFRTLRRDLHDLLDAQPRLSIAQALSQREAPQGLGSVIGYLSRGTRFGNVVAGEQELAQWRGGDGQVRRARIPLADVAEDAYEAEPVASVAQPRRGNDVYYLGDTGRLPLDARRALCQLLIGPSIDQLRHAKLWPALIRSEAAIRSALADLFLELVLDRDSGVAFTRQADTEDVDAPVLLRTSPLTFIDSVLLLYLRQQLAEADARGNRAVVADAEMAEALAIYEKNLSTDRAGFNRRVASAVQKMKDNHILTRLSGQEDRHEVSPALKLLFSAEDVSQLSAVYRQLRETPAAEA